MYGKSQESFFNQWNNNERYMDSFGKEHVKIKSEYINVIKTHRRSNVFYPEYWFLKNATLPSDHVDFFETYDKLFKEISRL